MFKNYIFDFDGTLMDTQAVILETIKKTINDMNLPPRTEAQCKSIIGIRTDEAGRYLYPELDISNEEFARIFRSNYEKIKKDAHERTFPGVLETLKFLHENNRGLAIASSRRLASLSDYLDGLGIKDWFDAIIGADSVTVGKPNPEPVLKVLSQQGWAANVTLVVGDADVDIMMGKGAGCKTCAVTYGNGSIELLKQANPTFLVDTFDKIAEI